MISNRFYEEAMRILLIYGHTFEWLIPFTEEENEFIFAFESMQFEHEDERVLQREFVIARQQYSFDYEKLTALKHGSKLHNRYFERLMQHHYQIGDTIRWGKRNDGIRGCKSVALSGIGEGCPGCGQLVCCCPDDGKP